MQAEPKFGQPTRGEPSEIWRDGRRMYLHADVAIVYLKVLSVPETQIDERERKLYSAKERVRMAESELGMQDAWVAQVKNALQEYEAQFTEFREQNQVVEELSRKIREEYSIADELPFATRSYFEAYKLIQEKKSSVVAQDIIERFERDFISSWRRATEAEMTEILQVHERSNSR